MQGAWNCRRDGLSRYCRLWSKYEIHRSSLWSFSKDAPIMVSIVDREEAVRKLVPFLDEMVAEGLVAMSRVQVIRYSKPVV